MKTYIFFFCGEIQPHHQVNHQEAPWMGDTLPGPGAPCHAAEGLWPQLPPQSARCATRRLLTSRRASPLKTAPARSSAQEIIIGSLYALSSCVCEEADSLEEPDHGGGVGTPGSRGQRLPFPEHTPSSPVLRSHLCLNQGRSIRFTKGHLK